MPVFAALVTSSSFAGSTACHRALSVPGAAERSSFVVAAYPDTQLTSADVTSADAGARAAADGGATEVKGPRSPRLRNARLSSPMPGGFLGGWPGDTGIDIAGNRLDVYAIAA